MKWFNKTFLDDRWTTTNILSYIFSWSTLLCTVNKADLLLPSTLKTNSCMSTSFSSLKDGLSLRLHIHLYFIATQYLWNYALVEDIDNWTRSYIHILKSSKIIFNGLVFTQIPSLEAFIITIRNAYSLKYLFMKFIDWERKGNFNE